jgi:hypothetical protein
MSCTNKPTTCYLRSRDMLAPQIELAFCKEHDPGDVGAKMRMDRGDALTTHVDGVRVEGIEGWPRRSCDHEKCYT